MNTAAILQLAEAIGLPVLDSAIRPLVQAQLIINPSASDTEIEEGITGSLKHAARARISWIVDLVWPALDPYLVQEIARCIAEVRAASVPVPAV